MDSQCVFLNFQKRRSPLIIIANPFVMSCCLALMTSLSGATTTQDIMVEMSSVFPISPITGSMPTFNPNVNKEFHHEPSPREIQDFLNKCPSFGAKLAQKFCHRPEYSCVGRCGDANKWWCRCDRLCPMYGDCCWDFEAECPTLAKDYRQHYSRIDVDIACLEGKAIVVGCGSNEGSMTIGEPHDNRHPIVSLNQEIYFQNSSILECFLQGHPQQTSNYVTTWMKQALVMEDLSLTVLEDFINTGRMNDQLYFVDQPTRPDREFRGCALNYVVWSKDNDIEMSGEEREEGVENGCRLDKPLSVSSLYDLCKKAGVYSNGSRDEAVTGVTYGITSMGTVDPGTTEGSGNRNRHLRVKRTTAKTVEKKDLSSKDYSNGAESLSKRRDLKSRKKWETASRSGRSQIIISLQYEYGVDIPAGIIFDIGPGYKRLPSKHIVSVECVKKPGSLKNCTLKHACKFGYIPIGLICRETNRLALRVIGLGSKVLVTRVIFDVFSFLLKSYNGTFHIPHGWDKQPQISMSHPFFTAAISLPVTSYDELDYPGTKLPFTDGVVDALLARNYGERLQNVLYCFVVKSDDDSDDDDGDDEIEERRNVNDIFLCDELAFEGVGLELRSHFKTDSGRVDMLGLTQSGREESNGQAGKVLEGTGHTRRVRHLLTMMIAVKSVKHF